MAGPQTETGCSALGRLCLPPRAAPEESGGASLGEETRLLGRQRARSRRQATRDWRRCTRDAPEGGELKRAFSQLRQGQPVGAVIAVLAACSICVVFLWMAGSGRQKSATLLFMLLVALYIPFLVNRGKRLWLAALPLLVFWIPGPLRVLSFAPLRALSLVEALVLLALFAAAVRALSARENLQPLGLRSFPWAGFLAFFAGAALTYLYAFHTGDELPVLRVFVFFPFTLGLLVMLVVQDAKDALKLLWVLVAATTVLGIVFLLGSRGVGPFSPDSYASGTGRASLSVSLPYLGTFALDPQGAADKFAFAFSVAWFLLLTSATGPKRLAAGAAAVVFATVVVSAQGRTGILACALSVTVFGIWAVRRGSAERVVAWWATGAGLGGVVGATVYLALHSANAAYAARVLTLSSAPMSNPSLVARVGYFREGLVDAMSHPEGLGLFAPPYGEGSTWLVHNLWLFAALSIGWLGLAGLVLILVRVGRVFIAGTRSVDDSGVRLAALGLVLLGNIVLISMTEPLVWEPYSAVLVWTPLWIAFAGVVRCNALRSTVGHRRYYRQSGVQIR